MKPKSSQIQIVRKLEEEKPTPLQAFLTGFFLFGLILCPLAIAGAILGGIWTEFGTTDFYGIYIGIGFGLLVTFILSLIFMKLATK